MDSPSSQKAEVFLFHLRILIQIRLSRIDNQLGGLNRSYSLRDPDYSMYILLVPWDKGKFMYRSTVEHPNNSL